MSSFTFYPPVGKTVLDESDVPVDADGVIVDEVTDYYRTLVYHGHLLTYDPRDPAPAGPSVGDFRMWTGTEWTPVDGVIISADTRVFDVTDYGATGNGVADDTAGIRAAIAAAIDTTGVYGDAGYRTGGVVYFPRPTVSTGYYRITDTITITNVKGLTLMGEGIGSVQLKWAGPSPSDTLDMFVVDGDSVQFVGLQMNKIGTYRPRAMIKIVPDTAGEHPCRNISIIDCAFDAFQYLQSKYCIDATAGTDHRVVRTKLWCSTEANCRLTNGARVTFEDSQNIGFGSVTGIGVDCVSGSFVWNGNGGGYFIVAGGADFKITAATGPCTINGYNCELSDCVLIAGTSPSSALMPVSFTGGRYDTSATTRRAMLLNAAGPYNIEGNLFYSGALSARLYLGSTATDATYHIEGNAFNNSAVDDYTYTRVASAVSTIYQCGFEFPTADYPIVTGDSNMYWTAGGYEFFAMPSYLAIGGIGYNGSVAKSWAGSKTFVSGQQELTVNLPQSEKNTSYAVMTSIEKASGTVPDDLSVTVNSKTSAGFNLRISSATTTFSVTVNYYIWRTA